MVGSEGGTLVRCYSGANMRLCIEAFMREYRVRWICNDVESAVIKKSVVAADEAVIEYILSELPWGGATQELTVRKATDADKEQMRILDELEEIRSDGVVEHWQYRCLKIDKEMSAGEVWDMIASLLALGG